MGADGVSSPIASRREKQLHAARQEQRLRLAEEKKALASRITKLALPTIFVDLAETEARGLSWNFSFKESQITWWGYILDDYLGQPTHRRDMIVK